MIKTAQKGRSLFLAAMFSVSIFCTALLAGMATVSAAPATTGTGGLRYTVSVAKFENRAGWYGQFDIGDAWGMVCTDILNQSGRFIVLGESDMRRDAMREQDLGASGRTVQGAITPVIGQMTPAQILLKGAITHVEEKTSGGFGGLYIGGVGLGGSTSHGQVNVTMYMVDTTTGQVLASTSVVGKTDSSSGFVGYSGHGWAGGVGGFQKSNVGKAIESAVQQGVQWMIAQLPRVPWQGNVVMVKDNEVYINRGSREGVAVGQTFSVGQADVIRDPNTGEVLDSSVNEVARLIVTSVREKMSVCEVMSGRIDAINAGMMVKP